MAYQNLVTIIDRSNSQTLRELRQRHLTEREIFSNARQMGDAGSPPTKASDPDRTAALIDLAKSGTEALRLRLDRLLSNILKKMRAAWLIRLAGAIVAVVAGTIGPVLIYSGVQAAITTLITGLSSACGGVVSILADQVVRTPSGIAVASPEQHAKIIAMRTGLEKVLLRLARADALPISQSEAEQLLSKLDDEAAQLIQFEGA